MKNFRMRENAEREREGEVILDSLWIPLERLKSHHDLVKGRLPK